MKINKTLKIEEDKLKGFLLTKMCKQKFNLKKVGGQYSMPQASVNVLD